MYRENNGLIEINITHDLSRPVSRGRRESQSRPDGNPIRTPKIEIKFFDTRSVQ